MTKGEIELAIRRALNLFDRWNDVTGYVPKASGYYYEIQGCIESAVHCGAQAATGDYKTIPDCDDENIQEFTPVGTDNDWKRRYQEAEAELKKLEEIDLVEVFCNDLDYKGRDGFCKGEGKCNDDRCPKWRPAKGVE
jgi:hypothetical protein